MNLPPLIEQFIEHRQSLGELQQEHYTLRAFGRFIGADVEADNVSPEQVNDFLSSSGPITLTWHTKLSLLRTFYQYAVSRGYVASAPLPTVLPKRPPAFVPYVYSQHELIRLLRAAKRFNRSSCLPPGTLHLMLLVLYGTGLRIRELVDLERDDVNLKECLLKVRQSKFGKTRLVPFGQQLYQPLFDYDRQRPASRDGAPFFVTCLGDRVKPDTLQHNYRILCERTGVRRTDGASEQPRIHDLRHTFAVHRLTSWYQQGADVQTLLPLLSVYLGHVHIRATQVYLSMTAELLDEAGKRFERYVTKEAYRG